MKTLPPRSFAALRMTAVGRVRNEPVILSEAKDLGGGRES